jgi:hypothetical protein
MALPFCCPGQHFFDHRSIPPAARSPLPRAHAHSPDLNGSVTEPSVGPTRLLGNSPSFFARRLPVSFAHIGRKNGVRMRTAKKNDKEFR